MLIFGPLSNQSLASSDTNVHFFSAQNDKHLVSFFVKIAETINDKSVGLSDQSSLQSMEGLLLTFNGEEDVRIWTKFMKFPIDIIFIDKKGRISEIFHSVSPGSDKIFESVSPSRYVLEINSGEAKRFKLEKMTIYAYKAINELVSGRPL